MVPNVPLAVKEPILRAIDHGAHPGETLEVFPRSAEIRGASNRERIGERRHVTAILTFRFQECQSSRLPSRQGATTNLLSPARGPVASRQRYVVSPNRPKGPEVSRTSP